MNYRETVFTPRGFLIVGGAVLLLLGIVGFLNVFTSSAFYLTAGENFAHVVLGLVALAAVFVPGLNTALEPYYRWLVILVGVIALFFGVYGFIIPAGNPPTVLNTFGLANLEIVDNLIHLVVAAWAFLAAFWAPQRGYVDEVDRHSVDQEARASVEREPGSFLCHRIGSGDCRRRTGLLTSARLASNVTVIRTNVVSTRARSNCIRCPPNPANDAVSTGRSTATRAISKVVAKMSRVRCSGCHGVGPKGKPVVRETNHITITAALTRIAAMASSDDLLIRYACAQIAWNHASTRKKRPKAMSAQVFPDDGEMDRSGAQ